MIDPRLCRHETTAFRRKTASNGASMLGEQCLACGRKKGDWLPKAFGNGRETPPWDEELPLRVEREWHECRATVQRERSAGWWATYEEHLRSPHWSWLREQVRQRANGLCEGCRLFPGKHAHHLTYDHLGDELLFELVWLCEACHQKVHPHRDMAE